MMSESEEDGRTRLSTIEVVRQLQAITEVYGVRLQRAAGLPGDAGGCILMTAIGCDVLRTLGLTADPYPVSILGQNASYRAWAGSDRSASKPPDAYAFGDKGAYEAVHRPNGPSDVPDGELRGHLMIHLPVDELLVDLDLRQFSRPEQGFTLPATMWWPWPTGKSSAIWEFPEGGSLSIRYTPEDYSSRASGLEFGDVRARVVPLIVQAIRDDAPLDLQLLLERGK